MPRRTRLVLTAWLACVCLLLQLCVPDLAMAAADPGLCLGHASAGGGPKPPWHGHPPACAFCLAQAALALGPVPGVALPRPSTAPSAVQAPWPAGIVPVPLFLTRTRGRAPPEPG